MVPMVTNGIIVVIIVNFGVAWGEFLLSKTLNTSQAAQTLPVVLATGIGGRGAWGWNRIAAVSMMTIAPGLIAFALVFGWVALTGGQDKTVSLQAPDTHRANDSTGLIGYTYGRIAGRVNAERRTVRPSRGDLSFRATRIPLPPPPAVALISTG